MRYLAWPWQTALASQEMFVTPRAMADGRAKLRAERCPSHTGLTPCCTPPAAPARCFLFCESHFDCHVFAFISFPAPYMTHPQQDRGARTELGCPGSSLPHFPALFWAAFWKAVPRWGAVRQAAGINSPCSWQPGSVLLCRTGTWGLSPSRALMQEAEMLLPL